MNIVDLTAGQRRVVGWAVTLLSVSVIVAVLAAGLQLLVRFLSFFAPVLTPLAVAAVLAVMLRPAYEGLLARVRWPWLAVLLVLLPTAALLWLFGSLITAQLSGLIENLPGWLALLEKQLREWMPQVELWWQEAASADQVRSQLDARSGWLVQQAGQLVKRLWSAGLGVAGFASGLLSWVVLPVYLFFLLTAKPLRWDYMQSVLPFLKQQTRDDIAYLLREFVDILVAFFRGQLLIAGAQGVLYAAGFALAGLHYGVAIGLLLGFLNIIPYLGNLIGLAVALPLAYFQPGGGWPVLAGVLVAFSVTQAVEAYVLTPRIMGQRTGLHPMAIIFALFFWGLALNGLLGMILAIPLTAFLVVFWRLLKARYFKEIV